MLGRTKPDPSLFVSDDERFSDLLMLGKAVRGFWDTIYVGIASASVRSCLRRIEGEAYCQYLLDLLYWLMLQDEQKQNDTLRRINNHFGGLSPKEHEIRQVQAMLYRIFLHQHPYHKEKIISLLFPINTFLAKRVDSDTPATGLQGIVNLLTGKPGTLIAYNPETNKSELALPDHSQQLLLTGPKTDGQPGKGQEEKTPPRPEYPGHIFNEEVIASNIDALINSDFDISEGLREAHGKKQSTEALGQLYTVVRHILDGQLPIYTVASKAQANKAIKKFRSPVLVQNVKVNVFANILCNCLQEFPDLREPLTSGLKGLSHAQPLLFNDLLWEVLGITDKAIPKTLPGSGFAKDDGDFLNKPIDFTRSMPAQTAKESAEEKDLNSLSLADLHPLTRLQNIYEQNLIDAKRLANYDPYCREAICLILCGKARPEDEELNRGWKSWQKIVHLDKSPDSKVQEFSRIINQIHDLAVKREFIREETAREITDLFKLTKELLDSHSITVIPRKGLRRIIVGQVPIDSWLKQNNYQQDKIRLIVNGELIRIEDYAKSALERGDVIELVIF